MFGESDSESPRVGSPWDSFVSAPSPASAAELEVKTRLSEGLPKLVPEVEYGNVEYKLKLVTPSPERFLRLVTQLKWRLLEGGGQAYYELGVADAGHLVGLPRRELEQSLETLEMMAGEIGASVIVVKEVEVPAALVGRGMGAALGVPQRTPGPVLEREASTTTETETSATEDDDDLLAALELGPETPPRGAQPIAVRQTRFAAPTPAARSHPERPAAQASPAILPAADPDTDPLFHSDFDIEIASVYKPRPHRSRPASGGAPQSRYTKRGTAPRPKRPRVEMDPAQRAEEKRAKRDARRDARRKALLMPDADDADARDEHAASKAAQDLQDLHVGLEAMLLEQRPMREDSGRRDGADGDDGDEDVVVVDSLEPRLIVEALVVRKLALEEAFLDFGGFALEI